MTQPSPENSSPVSNFKSSAFSQRRIDVYEILESASPYDITNLLIHSLSGLGDENQTGFLHRDVIDLFVQTTKLQYNLVDRGKNIKEILVEESIHLLCRARQILSYRIIIQILLPDPERRLILKLLSLLGSLVGRRELTKMNSDSIARCIAVSVFGYPDNTSSDFEVLGVMKYYIDTLKNLIELSDELEILPAILYEEIFTHLQQSSDYEQFKLCLRREVIKNKNLSSDFDNSEVQFSSSQRATNLLAENKWFGKGLENRRRSKEAYGDGGSRSDDGGNNSHFILPYPRVDKTTSAQKLKRALLSSPFLTWKKQRCSRHSK